MAFATVTLEQWRAQVEADLKGASFEKTLVTKTEGLTVLPLYVTGPQLPPLPFGGEGRGEGKNLVSTLAFHEAGADAVDEVAISLSLGAQALNATATHASPLIEVSVGRDTFIELAKLRALRLCWAKLLVAAKVEPRFTIRAVCSSRTLTQRDPWVNMLRTTTQVFAAILGQADEIIPSRYDQELGESALGKRVAENTLRILLEESGLGRIADPAAGSYYLDTLTDDLAREAWKRFQSWEAEGGFTAVESKINAELEKKWADRAAAIAKRKIAILGVSEFANPGEKLPAAAHAFSGPGHRDAEQFEALRLRADALAPTAVLFTLGTLAESRGRVGFSSNFLSAGGITTRESTTPEPATLAVICGTDDRYASEGVAAAKSLKSAGVKRLLVAGKPGANEAELRAAGVDGFIFMGSDLIETLTSLLELYA